MSQTNETKVEGSTTACVLNQNTKMHHEVEELLSDCEMYEIKGGKLAPMAEAGCHCCSCSCKKRA